jgi:hypothetical protein
MPPHWVPIIMSNLLLVAKTFLMHSMDLTYSIRNSKLLTRLPNMSVVAITLTNNSPGENIQCGVNCNDEAVLQFEILPSIVQLPGLSLDEELNCTQKPKCNYKFSWIRGLYQPSYFYRSAQSTFQSQQGSLLKATHA